MDINDTPNAAMIRIKAVVEIPVQFAMMAWYPKRNGLLVICPLQTVFVVLWELPNDIHTDIHTNLVGMYG